MQAPFKQRPKRRLLKLVLTIVAGLVVVYELVIPTVSRSAVSPLPIAD